MNRYIAPLILGFGAAATALTATARDPETPKHAFRDIVFDGYAFSNNGCFPKARFGREKLDLGDLETLKDTGTLPGKKLTFATIFPAGTSDEDARKQIEAVQQQLGQAYRSLRRRPDCKPNQ